MEKKSKKVLRIFKRIFGIFWLIIGGTLTFLTAYWIIGVPLIIWGAVLYDKSKIEEMKNEQGTIQE